MCEILDNTKDLVNKLLEDLDIEQAETINDFKKEPLEEALSIIDLMKLGLEETLLMMLDFLIKLGPEALTFLQKGKDIYMTIKSIVNTDEKDDRTLLEKILDGL